MIADKPPERRPSPPALVSSGPVTIEGQLLSNVTAIAAGNQHSLAVECDGSVIAWGNRQFYRDVPEGLSNVVSIAAGEGFCLAITTNKTVAERFQQ